MFSLFLTSAKSNDIKNISVKSILVQKIAYSSIYDIIMSPEDFEIKNKQRFASVITKVPIHCLLEMSKID